MAMSIREELTEIIVGKEDRSTKAQRRSCRHTRGIILMPRTAQYGSVFIFLIVLTLNAFYHAQLTKAI